MNKKFTYNPILHRISTFNKGDEISVLLKGKYYGRSGHIIECNMDGFYKVLLADNTFLYLTREHLYKNPFLSKRINGQDVEYSSLNNNTNHSMYNCTIEHR